MQFAVQNYNFFRKHASIWAKNYGKIHFLFVYAEEGIIGNPIGVRFFLQTTSIEVRHGGLG